MLRNLLACQCDQIDTDEKRKGEEPDVPACHFHRLYLWHHTQADLQPGLCAVSVCAESDDGWNRFAAVFRQQKERPGEQSLILGFVRRQTMIAGRSPMNTWIERTKEDEP